MAKTKLVNLIRIAPHHSKRFWARATLSCARPKGSVLPGVAQIFNLLYRRDALGWTFEIEGAFGNSRRPQNAILRYGRLQICATQSPLYDRARLTDYRTSTFPLPKSGCAS
ncbi:MAG: hypothetical protein HY735_11425 [Verrucomicrobia bacterium]|nr:hypothetical protein [Verrucomicrobiota bacterium]